VQAVLKLGHCLAKTIKLLLTVTQFVFLRRLQCGLNPHEDFLVEPEACKSLCDRYVDSVLASVRFATSGTCTPCTVIVDMSLLLFAGHHMTTTTADENPSVQMIPILRVRVMRPTLLKFLLNPLKEIGGNERVVITFELLSHPGEPARVELVLQDLLD